MARDLDHALVGGFSAERQRVDVAFQRAAHAQAIPVVSPDLVLGQLCDRPGGVIAPGHDRLDLPGISECLALAARAVAWDQAAPGRDASVLHGLDVSSDRVRLRSTTDETEQGEARGHRAARDSAHERRRRPPNSTTLNVVQSPVAVTTIRASEARRSRPRGTPPDRACNRVIARDS